MNIARKVIISIFAPVLIGFPILNISIRTNLQRSGSGWSWTPVALYESKLVWWLLILGTAIFLYTFWHNKEKDSEENI